jgi:hypothetical protein
MKKSVFKILLPVAGIMLLILSVLALNYLLAGIGIGLAGAIILGPTVEQDEGKTGGVVFVRGKTGPYTRAKVKPRNPQTNYQEAVRQEMRNFAKQWKLSQVDQKGFIDYAETHPIKGPMGNTAFISGFNWFVKMNRIAQMTGASLITTPPTSDTIFPIMTGLTLATTTGPDTVTVEPIKNGNYPTGVKIEIFATRQLSPGVFSTKNFRLIGVYDPTSSPAINITTDYEARFSTLKNGLKIFFMARLIMPTGEADLYVKQSSVVVTAP